LGDNENVEMPTGILVGKGMRWEGVKVINVQKGYKKGRKAGRD
jgi:hypothetical protein